MRIAYVITESYSTSPYNGIRIQAETWANELEKKGNEVIRINPWEYHDWKSYDVVHIFGPCEFIFNFVSALQKYNERIVFSPIIDTIQSVWMYRLLTYWGCRKLRLTSSNYMIRQTKQYIKKWLARSQYEANYINKAYSVPLSDISIVPLSFRLPICENYTQKENFCFHVSKITDSRKNVMRLIEAAIKYKFKLVLAGSISSEADFAKMKKVIDNNDNVLYLGRISDEKLIELYKRAKVFALPSINEGVGMVAVEAASYGDDIVITKIGGPKEYYENLAYVVNPYDVDEIGHAVLMAMNAKDRQPMLMKYVQNNYNLSRCVDLLLDCYQSIQK